MINNSRWPAFGRPPRGGVFRPAFSWSDTDYWLILVQVGISWVIVGQTGVLVDLFWVIMSQTGVIVGPTGIIVGLSEVIVGQTWVIVGLSWVKLGS